MTVEPMKNLLSIAGTGMAVIYLFLVLISKGIESMQKYNKATAAVIGGAITTVLVALFPEWGQEVTGAIGTLVTAGLVWLVPNKESA